MSMLWPKVCLAEVIREEREPVGTVDGDGLPVFGVTNIEGVTQTGIDTSEDRSKYLRLRPGSFVYNPYRANVGSLGLSSQTEDGIVSPAYVVFAPTDRINAKFLHYFLKSARGNQLINFYGNRGSVRGALRFDDLCQIEIPLPLLEEQRRVVARIEELAAQIREARDLRKEAVEEADALLLSMLHELFVLGSTTWHPLPMREAVEINDKQIDTTLPEYSRLPHISGQNMESKTCRLLPWRTADEDGVKSSNYLFSRGTVLYSKIRPYLRKAVFADFQGVCSADVYPICVINPEIDPHFMKWTLVAEPFTNFANQLSGRTRMPKLNRQQLFSFPFSHPALLVQRRIVAELDALHAQVDALKRLQAETATELDALLPSILDRAFKGEL